MREHVVAQIRDDPIAERRDQVEPQRTREREHGGDADHHAEIAVDQVALAGKAEIDHAPDGERYRERRQSRDRKGDEGKENADAVAPEVRQQQNERTQLDLAAWPGLFPGRF